MDRTNFQKFTDKQKYCNSLFFCKQKRLSSKNVRILTMPIPFIFGAAAAAAAITGAVQAIAGMDKLNQARQIGESAQQKYENELKELEINKEKLEQIAQDYIKLHVDVNRLTIKRFLSLIQSLDQNFSKKDVNVLRNLKISSNQCKKYQGYVLQAEELFSGGSTMLKVGTITSQGLVALTGIIGTASTGTAISSLSGAAATNATLAWFGGGSLASGGGGMALGSLVLGGVALGSALMVGGFIVAEKGDEALIKAKEYQSQVNQAIIQIHSAKSFLKQVEKRITDLSSIVRSLDNRIIQILNKLESKPFDYNKNINSLKWLVTLVKTLEKIQKTPLLDKKGNLNPATEILLHKDLVKRVEKEQYTIELFRLTGFTLLALLVLVFSGWSIFRVMNLEHISIPVNSKDLKSK